MSFNPTSYRRRIELLDADRSTLLEVLCDLDLGINQVEDASFELLRQGGCGSGSITLTKTFDDDIIETGHWIRMSYASGGDSASSVGDDPWYLGRVEEIESSSPSGQTCRLYGAISLLSDIPIGGKDSLLDCRGPHRYAATDLFVHDPDHDVQSWDTIDNYTSLVQAIFDQYIQPQTGLTLGEIEAPSSEVDFSSFVFRGEESISQVLRNLAVTQYGASYGVNAKDEFFFVQKNTSTLATFQESLDLQALKRKSDRSLLYNRVNLTGGYVYLPEQIWGGYRYQAIQCFTESVDVYGPKTIAIYMPWIRTDEDALAFLAQFFNKYGQPLIRYDLTTLPQSVLLHPWDGYILLKDKDGTTLVTDQFERVQVEFNDAPIFTITTGPEDLQFPASPEPQRWEIEEKQGPGVPEPSDEVTATLTLSGGSGTETGSTGSGTDCDTNCFPLCFGLDSFLDWLDQLPSGCRWFGCDEAGNPIIICASDLSSGACPSGYICTDEPSYTFDSRCEEPGSLPSGCRWLGYCGSQGTEVLDCPSGFCPSGFICVSDSSLPFSSSASFSSSVEECLPVCNVECINGEIVVTKLTYAELAELLAPHL